MNMNIQYEYFAIFWHEMRHVFFFLLIFILIICYFLDGLRLPDQCTHAPNKK